MPLSQAFDMFSSLAAGPEVAITGTVSLTASAFGKMHKISGTSADYTITLPAVSGNAGKFIGFRVADIAAASKLYTLDGNGSETINGDTTKIQWAEEAKILLCTGAEWKKVAGHSVPMACIISNNQSSGAYDAFANGGPSVVPMDTTDLDNTGMMADLANDRITCKRSGRYSLTGAINATGNNTGTVGITAAAVRLFVNVGGFVQMELSASSGGYPGPMGAANASLTAGSTYNLQAFQNTGSGQFFFGGKQCYIGAVEIVAW